MNRSLWLILTSSIMPANPGSTYPIELRIVIVDVDDLNAHSGGGCERWVPAVDGDHRELCSGSLLVVYASRLCYHT